MPANEQKMIPDIEERIRDAEWASERIESLRSLPPAKRWALREERKKRERERAHILWNIDRLELERCDKCKGNEDEWIYCDCEATHKIKGLREQLEQLIEPRKGYPEPRNPWINVAEKNGISEATFRSRVHLGWDEEKAATTPVIKKNWTSEEDAIIQQGFLDKKTYKEIVEQLPGRAYRSVLERGRKIRKKMKVEGLL